MARTPAFRPYESTLTPRAEPQRFAREEDVSSGDMSIARSLARAGEALGQVYEVDRERRLNEARIDVTRRMAMFRSDANQALTTMQQEAPDGWRDLHQNYSQRFNELRNNYLGDPTLTKEARAMFEEQAVVFEQQALDTAMSEERRQYGLWQVDAVSAAVEAGGNVLITDPSQYEATRLDALETLGSISDPNMRRDATANMEESYARYAVSGLIQANPREALNALRDPEAGGAYARLAPAARATAINAAEAEIERRAARWRAQVSQSVAAAERMMELGLPTENAPSVETVRSALGPERALAYEASRAMSDQFGRLATMPASDLLAIAGDANPRDNERDAVLHMAERRAAAAILEQRREDPMQYQVRHGLTAPADLVELFNQGDWGQVNGILNGRAASAQQNAERFGMAPMPLTAFEANVIGQRVREMSAEQRGAFLRNAAAWMGRDSAPYRAMMAQLFPDSPSTAYAGYITGAAGERGARDAQLILRGEDILAGRAENGESGGRSRLVDMPPEDNLRRAFRREVGEAYAPINNLGGAREAEAQAYEVFRSAYAALAESRGGTGDAVNFADARRAAQIATGGTVVWDNRRTLIPPGMNEQQFSAAVRDGFSRYQQLQSVNPRDYTLMPLGATQSGMRYGVFDGEDPVRSPSGRPIEIEVRRR